MSITVIKCINRYGCGLFNSCCAMKKALTMISWNFLHSFDKQDFPYFATNSWKIPGIIQLNSWKQKEKVIIKVIVKSQGRDKMAEKWLQENVNISPKKTVTCENFL